MKYISALGPVDDGGKSLTARDLYNYCLHMWKSRVV